MHLIKSIFLLFILISAVVGGIYIAHDRDLIPQDTLGGKPYQSAEWMVNQINPLLSQYEPAISHVQTVQKETGAVLGDFIQVNEKDKEKKLYEKTLDQAQYLYCKQVVEQWEKETTD